MHNNHLRGFYQLGEHVTERAVSKARQSEAMG